MHIAVSGAGPIGSAVSSSSLACNARALPYDVLIEYAVDVFWGDRFTITDGVGQIEQAIDDRHSIDVGIKHDGTGAQAFGPVLADLLPKCSGVVPVVVDWREVAAVGPDVVVEPELAHKHLPGFAVDAHDLAVVLFMRPAGRRDRVAVLGVQRGVVLTRRVLTTRQRAPGPVGSPGRISITVIPVTGPAVAGRVRHFVDALRPRATDLVLGQWHHGPGLVVGKLEARIGLPDPVL